MRKNREGKMRETRLRRRAAACGMSILLSLTGLISVPGVETEREITRLKPSDATTQTIRETEFTGSEADASREPEGLAPGGSDGIDPSVPEGLAPGGTGGIDPSVPEGLAPGGSGGIDPSMPEGAAPGETGGMDLPAPDETESDGAGFSAPDETERTAPVGMNLPGPDEPVLAGPVELNTGGLILDPDMGSQAGCVPDALFDDAQNPDTEFLETEALVFLDGGIRKKGLDTEHPVKDKLSDTEPENTDGQGTEKKDAGKPDPLIQGPEEDPDPEAAERGGTASETESEGEMAPALYGYEHSLTLRELALLPEEIAGAATEIDPDQLHVHGRADGMLMAAAEELSLWTCSDYYVNEPDLHHVSKTDDFSLKYQIEFHTSTDLEEGSVEIRVPEALLRDRSSQAVNPCQIGVPKGTPDAFAESLNSPFNWYRDTAEESLVFFNYRPIASGTNTAFQVLYHPVEIFSLTDGSEWTVTPQIEVRLSDGSKQSRSMEELSGSIDSGAELLSASADAFSDGTISCMPALYTKDQVQRVLGGSLPAYLNGQEKEWLFVAWRIDSQGQFSQPWTMQIDGELSASGVSGTDDSFVVGSITRIAGAAEGSTGDGSIVSRYVPQERGFAIAALSSQDLSRYTGPGRFHLLTTVVTAVRKRALKNNASVIKLDAALALTPSDGLDEVSTNTAPASWTFVDYEWKYRGNDVGIFAWTGEPSSGGTVSYNRRSVSLSGWVNEYRLMKESGKEAGSVPLRIRSECRGYACTHETEGSAAGSYKDGCGYEVTTVDDALYLAGLSDEAGQGIQLLGAQDYYYTDVTVSIRDRGMDVYEDRTCAPMPEEECPGADRSTTIWAMYENSDDFELAAELPWNSSGRISYTFPKQQLQRKIWRVKVVHHAADYDSFCTIDSRLCIKPGSPVCERLLSQAGPDTLTAFEVEHLGSVLARSTGGDSQEWFHDTSDEQYDEDSEPGLADLTRFLYGIFSMRANSFARLTSLKKHAKAVKSVSRENDPVNGCTAKKRRSGSRQEMCS